MSSAETNTPSDHGEPYAEPAIADVDDVSYAEHSGVPDNVIALDGYRQEHRAQADGSIAANDDDIFETIEQVMVAGLVGELEQSDLVAAVAPEDTSTEPHGIEQTDKTIILGAAEKLRLVKRAQRGDSYALDALIRASLPLVCKLASLPDFQIPYEDRLQIGLMELPGLVMKFDPRKGKNFDKYAAPRVLWKIYDEIRYGNQALTRMQYSRLRQAVNHDDHSERSRLLHEMATDPDKRRRVSEVGAYVTDAGIIHSEPTSIDQLSEAGHPLKLSKVGADPEEDEVFAEVALKFSRQELEEVVMKLPPRQRYVIACYYDLFGGTIGGATQKQIAREMGLTQPAVSLIHRRALQNLEILMDGGELEPPAAPKPNRLAILGSSKPNEERLDFLERTYWELLKYESAELSDDEQQSLIESLPESWKHGEMTIDGKHYAILKRELLDAQEFDLTQYNDERRRLFYHGDGLVLATERLSLKDLRAVIDIEARALDPVFFPVDPTLKDLLSPGELRVVSQLHKGYKKIAADNGLSEQTVPSYLHRASTKLGAESSSDLAVIAAFGGLIPLRKVPTGRTAFLTDVEKRILAEYHGMRYEKTTEALGILEYQLKKHWRVIFKKTGATSQRQATLMAIKDGLIEKSS